MNQYDTTVKNLLSYLADRHQCISSRISHEQCYREYRQFLQDNNFSMSEEHTGQWISCIRERYSRQKSYYWGQYVKQLIVFSSTGIIPDWTYVNTLDTKS